MKEKVVEILMYLMSAMQDNKSVSDSDLEDLKSRGYTQTEISAAFSWLYDHGTSGPGPSRKTGEGAEASRRVFHDAERAMLSQDGQGYLIQMTELGLLTPFDLEAVIERVMMGGYEQISIEELKEIVSSVLFSRDQGRDRNGRTMLNSGDTIH